MKALIKIVLLFALYIAVLTACEKNEEKEGFDIPITQEIVFECYYINYAWGYSHSGFLIDRNGNIHTYSQHEFGYNPSWNFPDKDGYISQEAIRENIDKTELSESQINIVELEKYAKKIALVKDNDYSEKQNAADMGAHVNVCYLYDEETKLYKQIVLSESGDWIRTNRHSVAREIDEWLRTIK